MSHIIDDAHEAGRLIAVASFPWRHGRLDASMATAFRAVARRLAQVGVPITGPAVGYYTRSPDGRFRVSAGYVVDQAFESDGTVEAMRLPAGRVATTVHVGPYERLEEAYDSLQDFAARHHLALDQSVMWEEYLSDSDVDPGQVHTRVSWPVTHLNLGAPVG